MGLIVNSKTGLGRLGAGTRVDRLRAGSASHLGWPATGSAVRQVGVRRLLAVLMLAVGAVVGLTGAALTAAVASTYGYDAIATNGQADFEHVAVSLTLAGPSKGSVSPAALSFGASTTLSSLSNATNSVRTSDLVDGPLWTSSKKSSSAQNALRHFNDHGADFPDVQNAMEYAAKAQDFLRTPPGGILTRVRPNGDIVRYHPGSNTFGVMDANGAPRTLFRPDPAVHGHATNLDYFYAQ